MKHSITSLLCVAIATLLGFAPSEGNAAVCSIPGKPWVEGKTTRTVTVPVFGITPEGDASRAIKVFADGKVDYFTITGLPPGMTYRVFTPEDTSELNLCAQITGTPNRVGRYLLTIRAGNECGVSVPYYHYFDVTPIGANLACTYQGIVDHSTAHNQGLGGLVQVTVGTTGTFTGKIWFGARMCAFSGPLAINKEEDVTGRATFRCGTTTMTLDIYIDAATKVLQGAVKGDDKIDYLAFEARCSAWNTTTNKYPKAGTYTAALLPPDTGTSKEAAEAAPQGIGYFGGTIGINGAVSMAARLADNTVITAASLLGGDETFALHYLLYGGTGSAQGWILAGNGDLNGQMKWIKLPQAGATRSYKAGFPLHTLTVVGGFKAHVPTGGNRWLGAAATTGATPNSKVTFDLGGLYGPLSQAVIINSANLATAQVGGFASCAIDNANTRFLGSFKAQSNTGLYYGVFIPRLGKGVGHFQLPEAPIATSKILSGRVQFTLP